MLQAQTQLANAQADQLGLERQRAVLEHAIAVLVGKAPSSFSLAARPSWQGVVPDVPFDVPSTLLQRRPDIAAAERRAAQANEQIGIAQAAFFPSLRLSGSAGLGAASIGDLFSASALVWSLGASLAQTLFDAGRARRPASRAPAPAWRRPPRATGRRCSRLSRTSRTSWSPSRILQQQLVLREDAAAQPPTWWSSRC